MPQPTLELGPHELFFAASNTPARAPAERIEAKGKPKRAFLARLEWFERDAQRSDVYQIFLRPEDAPDAPIISCRMSSPPRPKKQIEIPPLDAKKRLSWLKQSVKLERFARLWHPDGAPWGLSLNSDGIAEVYWPDRDDNAPESLTFRWRGPIQSAAPDDELAQIDLQSWPQNEFTAFCQSLYDDADSDLRGALKWHDTAPTARDAVAFGCQLGDWEQLRHLLRCALIVVTHECGISPSYARGQSYRQIDFLTRAEDRANVWFNRLRAAICEVVRPSFWPDEPIYVYAWRSARAHDDGRNLVECGVPTAHELVEAQVELRAWLRPHLAEAQIEALFVP